MVEKEQANGGANQFLQGKPENDDQDGSEVLKRDKRMMERTNSCKQNLRMKNKSEAKC